MIGRVMCICYLSRIFLKIGRGRPVMPMALILPSCFSFIRAGRVSSTIYDTEQSMNMLPLRTLLL